MAGGEVERVSAAYLDVDRFSVSFGALLAGFSVLQIDAKEANCA